MTGPAAAVVLAALLAAPAAASGAGPWEVPRDGQDRATRDAVYAAETCLGVQYSSFGRYGDCIDVVFASCRPWKGLPFGARDCLEGAHHTWRHIVWKSVAQLAREERGGRLPDGRLRAEALNDVWDAFSEAQCAIGLSPAHPYEDVVGRQVLACRTELAAAQAVRLWATLAP
jgi:hypothetical protein